MSEICGAVALIGAFLLISLFLLIATKELILCWIKRQQERGVSNEEIERKINRLLIDLQDKGRF